MGFERIEKPEGETPTLETPALASTPAPPTPGAYSWWTEGNRKMIVTIAALVVFGAVAITLLIVQPEGVGIMEFLGWAGSILLGGTGIFSTANLVEHKIKAGGSSITEG